MLFKDPYSNQILRYSFEIHFLKQPAQRYVMQGPSSFGIKYIKTKL